MGSVGEFELIRRLSPLLPSNDYVVVGAGDDCAVLDLGVEGQYTLFKTDAVVEGVHFVPEAEAERVGHKAMARVLSDFAAMGGTPVAAVVTLGLPPNFDADRVESLYRGMGRLAARHQVAIVGGETTTVRERWVVSVSAVGHVAKGRVILRSGARVGDALLVTGELGGSIEGKHLDFEPRLSEGRWLALQPGVHAMMDLSDGLAGDMRRMLGAGGGALGAELMESALPVSRAAKLAARRGDLAKPATLAALTDGEDFELLVAVAPGEVVRVRDGFMAQFPSVGIRCIGKVTAQPTFLLRTPRGPTPIPASGYEHFRR